MGTSQGSNIILIGMPGSGKSTIGRLVARRLGRGLIDTDRLIVKAQRMPLQQIVDQKGYLALRAIEEEILLGLACHDQVIATGGSAVYSDAAMAHLKAGGWVVFLDLPLVALEARVGNFFSRGLARRLDQSFAELFAERSPLYRRYADLTIDCFGLRPEQICARICERFR